jgi:transcriptional regulator
MSTDPCSRLPERDARIDVHRAKGRNQPASGSGFHLTIQCTPWYSIGMPNRPQSKTDVLQGTLDLMVLQTIDSLGPLHGYAIAARLEQVSSGALQLNMGTLYPALMRLEQRRLLRGTWGTTDNNRKARFYAITSAGRRQLATKKQTWDRMATIMHSVLRGDA